MTAVRVCSLSDIEKGSVISAEIGGIAVAVVHADDDAVYAVRDECSHAAVALSEGDVEDCTIECWLHGSRFDLRTGKPTGLPATTPVPVFAVRIDGDDVLIDPDTTLGDN